MPASCSRHRARRAQLRGGPGEVFYSEYSRAKGQRNINAVNIVFDLAARRMRVAR